jgi:hypothetical protein
MKLTRVERAILANQYRIFEFLDPKQSDSYKWVREVLECGYELEYEQIFQEVYDDDNALTKEECSEVVNIMAMFEALNRSYDTLKDKSGIEKALIDFTGFDGNNESKQMAFARFFCTAGSPRFQGLCKGDGFNSHMETLSRYRPMLVEWKRLKKSYQLTKEQIKQIIAV